jgi:hypothetical protein
MFFRIKGMVDFTKTSAYPIGYGVKIKEQEGLNMTEKM